MHLLSWQHLFDLGWLLILLFLFGYFWREWRAALATKSWLKTQGRIVECEWTTYGHRIWPKIAYVYQVNEDEFYGEHIFHYAAHNNPNSDYARMIAYRVADAYVKNEHIDVFYNPEKPEQAILDKTIPLKLKLILVMIGGLIALHLVVIL